MLNDSTRKTVFNAKWLFKVICFDVDKKPVASITRVGKQPVNRLFLVTPEHMHKIELGRKLVVVKSQVSQVSNDWCESAPVDFN